MQVSHPQLLNVAAYLERSVVNGPGTRFVIWLQGCPIRCPGCINKDLWPLEPKLLIPVMEMAERILRTQGIEGVTYSGGEPTIQAEPLCTLSQILRNQGLSILCYTGYTLTELQQRNDPWINKLLCLCDIIIDGPFIESEAAPLLWRGSKNQRIICLTERYRNLLEAAELKASRDVEFIIGSNGISCSGFFTEELINRIKEKLRALD